MPKTFLQKSINEIIRKNNNIIPEAWDLYNKNPINSGISKTLSCDCGHLGTAGCTAITVMINEERGNNNLYKNILEKLNFQMEEIKLFDSFAGIGALYKANKKLGIPIKLVGSSEIDPYAIMDYAVIHNLDLNNVEIKSEQEMKNYLMSINIGWDFEKQKSTIKSWKGEKLERLYKSCIAMNNYGDISIINPSDLPDFDLFNFSFCCQCISVAGKQEGMTKEDGSITRSGLYIYGMKIIKAKKPKYIMIENVKNLVGKKFKNDFNKIIKELQDNGYDTYWQVLNAKDYGIPQNRERVFVICIRKDIDNNNFEFPEGFDSGIRLKNILEDTVDEKYYLSEKTIELIKRHDATIDSIEGITQTALDASYYKGIGVRCGKVRCCFKVPSNNQIISIGQLSNEGSQVGKVYDSEGIATCQKINGGGLGSNTGLYLEKQEESPEPKIIDTRQHIDSRQGKTARIYEQYCPSITGTDYKEPKKVDYYGRIRKLIPLECLRLMGFDDEDYNKIKSIGMSDTQIYKQAGNSIVVNVLYYIFKNLFKEYIK